MESRNKMNINSSLIIDKLNNAMKKKKKRQKKTLEVNIVNVEMFMETTARNYTFT